ncbi:MAG: hypothetical protein HC846_00925 [Blastocatellia bacterium]|nr:hypothetical protein [Blastocatellia bacterium]
MPKLLVPATTTEKGMPYDELTEMYPRMLGQWTLEMNHVAQIVGGYDSQQKHIGQNGVRFTLIPKARQIEAVKFLSENALATPTWAIDKEILRRIEPVGALNRIRNSQNSVLNNLLSSARFARLVEQQALDGNSAYAPDEFLADVRNSVFSELTAPKIAVDAYRRNLHRSYLDIANTKLNGSALALPAGLPPGFAAQFISSGDERAYYRAELRALNDSVSSAIPKAADKATKIHLEGIRDQIGKILNPEGGSASASANRFALEFLEMMQNPDSCWMDYTIKK